MAALKFDGTINIPTIGSFIGSVIAAVVFIMAIKSDVKVHSAELSMLKQEVGELRRLQLYVSSRQEEQDTEVKATKQKVAHVEKLAAGSKKTALALTKAVPKIVATEVSNQLPPIVAAAPPPESKKTEEPK